MGLGPSVEQLRDQDVVGDGTGRTERIGHLEERGHDIVAFSLLAEVRRYLTTKAGQSPHPSAVPLGPEAVAYEMRYQTALHSGSLERAASNIRDLQRRRIGFGTAPSIGRWASSTEALIPADLGQEGRASRPLSALARGPTRSERGSRPAIRHN